MGTDYLPFASRNCGVGIMPEMTPGQRIAAEYAISEDECACAIDAALADAQEEEADRWREREAAVCPEDVGFPEFVRSLQKQLAAKEAEAATYREAIERVMNRWKHGDSNNPCPWDILEAALASNAGEALLVKINRLEMKLAQREEFITNGQVEIIEYVNASVQAQAASQKALLARLRAAEERADAAEASCANWDATRLQPLREKLRAAEESANFGRDAVQGLSEDLRAAEEKAAALEVTLSDVLAVVMIHIDRDAYLAADERTRIAGAIQAARAKEPTDA